MVEKPCCCSKFSILNEELKQYLQVKLFPPLCTQREMGLRQIEAGKDGLGWVCGGLKLWSSCLGLEGGQGFFKTWLLCNIC